MAQFLVLKDMRCNDRDIKIIRGAWQDHLSAKVWHDVSHESVPPGTTIHAGSIVDYDLPEDRLQRAISRGILAPPDANLHFDLDRVFDTRVPSTLDTKTMTPLSNLMREWGVYTLEDAISDTHVSRPLDDERLQVPLRLLLKKYASDGQINMWMRAAKNIVETTQQTVTAETTPPTLVKEN